MNSSTKYLALRVDASTYLGIRDGVPRLIEILQHQGAAATFFFNLGPDRSGRYPRVIFRRGITSGITRYGVSGLLHSLFLNRPLSDVLAAAMRSVKAAGFEVGLGSWDAMQWQRLAATAKPDWAEKRMQLGLARFQKIFLEPPQGHAAHGWRMNRHAVRLTQRMEFHYASDCRGTHPFRPVFNGEPIACPQWPTTLPTLDELLVGDYRNAAALGRAKDQLLAASATCRDHGHVFTLFAELEGRVLAPTFTQLLTGWQQQGYTFTGLGERAAHTDVSTLPWYHVVHAPLADSHEKTLMQGTEYLP